MVIVWLIFAIIFFKAWRLTTLLQRNHRQLLLFAGGGQNSERQNVERPIFRNLKITNIKITKDELFDNFIFEFIFSSFINYSHNLIIFQIVKY